MSLVKEWALRINTSVSMNSSRWRYETKSFHPTRNKDEIEVGSLYNVYQLRISDSTSIYTCLTWYNHDIHRFRSGMCVNLPLRTCSTGPSQLRLAGLTFSARKRFPVKIFRKIQIHPNIPLIVSHLHIQLRSQHPICKKKQNLPKNRSKNTIAKIISPIFFTRHVLWWSHKKNHWARWTLEAFQVVQVERSNLRTENRNDRNRSVKVWDPNTCGEIWWLQMLC